MRKWAWFVLFLLIKRKFTIIIAIDSSGPATWILVSNLAHDLWWKCDLGLQCRSLDEWRCTRFRMDFCLPFFLNCECRRRKCCLLVVKVKRKSYAKFLFCYPKFGVKLLTLFRVTFYFLLVLLHHFFCYFGAVCWQTSLLNLLLCMLLLFLNTGYWLVLCVLFIIIIPIRSSRLFCLT